MLEINGVSLLEVTHKQAVETVRSSPLVCHLKMERGIPPTPHKGVDNAVINAGVTALHSPGATVVPMEEILAAFPLAKQGQ